jgi:heat shock protein HtpX
MKRVLLFLATNLAIVLVLSVVAQLLGLDRYLAAKGVQLSQLLVVAALFGFGGAFISLAISKWMAKMSMGVQVIEQPRTPTEQWLIATVRRQAQAAGIGMPEVGIFASPEPNAFATGARRDASLVAVSTGLLERMSQNEVEAVLGHEISHVANGDMVTLTLIQGVVNTFVIFLARILGDLVDRTLFGRGQDEEAPQGNGPAYFILVIAFQLVLGFLANLIVLWFSRYREFRADRGGATLSGRENMIAALERLKASHELPAQFAAFGIAGGKPGTIAKLFMSHPPLEERIAALRSMPIGRNIPAPR